MRQCTSTLLFLNEIRCSDKSGNVQLTLLFKVLHGIKAFTKAIIDIYDERSEPPLKWKSFCVNAQTKSQFTVQGILFKGRGMNSVKVS